MIKELKNKEDSNRAVISLIDSKKIIGTGDKPIPSFLILQFSFENSKRKLICAAYYRALEVSRFLPINIAEICLIIDQLQSAFGGIEEFQLTIHAFLAKIIPNFNCLKVAEIDLEKNRGLISAAFYNKDYKKLIHFLRSKVPNDSYICLDGVTELYNVSGQT